MIFDGTLIYFDLNIRINLLQLYLDCSFWYKNTGFIKNKNKTPKNILLYMAPKHANEEIVLNLILTIFWANARIDLEFIFYKGKLIFFIYYEGYKYKLTQVSIMITLRIGNAISWSNSKIVLHVKHIMVCLFGFVDGIWWKMS